MINKGKENIESNCIYDMILKYKKDWYEVNVKILIWWVYGCLLY